MFNIKGFKASLDRLLMISIGKQITLLVVSLFIIGFVFFCVGSFLNISFANSNDRKLNEIGNAINHGDVSVAKEASTSDKVLYVFSRLIDPGNIEDSEDHVYAVILSLIGWVLCGGFFIAILTNGYFERIKKIEQGITRYRFKNHHVIIGSNAMTMNIIKQIRKSGEENANKSIVVFSSQDALKLRANFRAFLTKKEEKNLFVFKGDRASKEHLEALRLQFATSIYILGEQEEIGLDSKNVNCIHLISDIIHNCSRKGIVEKKACFLLLDNLNTFDLLQNNSLESRIKEALNVKAFNVHETWASKVFSNEKINEEQDFTKIFTKIKSLEKKVQDNECSDSQALRFVIVGFNRMGKALVNQATRILHLGDKRKIIITVIDKKADKLEDSFRALRPGLDLIPDLDFEFIAEDVESKTVRDQLFDWQSNEALISVAICLRNPDVSLFVGLNLPRIIYDQKTPILIRQEQLHGFARSINDGGYYKELIFFGMLTDVVSSDLIREKIAQEKHLKYLETAKSGPNFNPVENKNHREWDQLLESTRWSNRYAVDIFPMKHLALELYSDLFSKEELTDYKEKLQAIFYTRLWIEDFYKMDTDTKEKDMKLRKESVIKKIGVERFKMLNQLFNGNGVREKDMHLLKSDLELLSEIEHNRWCGERVIAGWANAKITDRNRFLHADLIHYSELDALTKMYDREASVDFFEYINYN